MPYADPVAQREYQRRWMADRRAAALEGRSCVFCGSTDELEFHHFDAADKIDHKVWSWSRARRDAELAKCIVLCADCHQRRHQEDAPRFCQRGHEFTAKNTYVKPGTGRRECRTCRGLRHTTAYVTPPGAALSLDREVTDPRSSRHRGVSDAAHSRPAREGLLDPGEGARDA